LNIRVLIVCSGNSKPGEAFNFSLHHSFIFEQTESLRKIEIDFNFFFLKGKGITGYLKNYQNYIKLLNSFKPDIVHAHYGLSGLFANLQRKIPVITTFHGSDVFLFKANRMMSIISHVLSKKSIVVNSKMAKILRLRNKTHIIPCGVDIKLSYPYKEEHSLCPPQLERVKTNILFSSRFDYYEKNFPLAKEVIALLGPDYNLIELKGYSRVEVNQLMNYCDVALMTSISEGSPLFIKEAMACNCPIVSTDVGDVREIIGNTNGCYITSFDPTEIAEKVKLAVQFHKIYKYTKGRDRIIELGLDSETIARKILEVYKSVT